MRTRKILVAFPVLMILGVAGALVLRPAGHVMGASDTATELGLRNRDIELYQRRIAEDPQSATDWTQLAGLYLQRAREAGDYEDFRNAEKAARTAWSLRESRNGKALHMLASALLAQHKFVEARAAAEQLVTLDPNIVSWRALRAEIQLELGDYDAAAASFARLEFAKEDLTVAPRLARWYELTGRTAQARLLLRQAREEATRSDLPREQKAWFYLRVADHALRNGRVREAVREAERGLQINTGDVRLLGLLARVAHERAEWRSVVNLVGPIIDRVDMTTLSLLGDAYAQLGGHTLAENIYARIEQMAAENPEPFNRQWTQFRLDHGRELEATVALLEREAVERPDVLGYDMLAYGYYLVGRYEDARGAMQKALRLGMHDARIEEHARMILNAPKP